MCAAPFNNGATPPVSTQAAPLFTCNGAAPVGIDVSAWLPPLHRHACNTFTNVHLSVWLDLSCPTIASLVLSPVGHAYLPLPTVHEPAGLRVLGLRPHLRTLAAVHDQLDHQRLRKYHIYTGAGYLHT